MSVSAFIRRLVVPALAVIVAGCSVDKTELPALSGPSELALSITLAANPDVLSQDGASQSQIIVQARNANGQPARDVPIRVEIVVGGVAADFGRLSARTVVTGPDGRASLTYTAPPPPPEPVDNFTIVTILAIPSGTDFSNAVARSVDIRLTPPGVILPPVGTPVPQFTFSPSSPLEGQAVQFSAAGTDIGAGASQATFKWDFGDGSSAAGLNASHKYSRSGTFNVTLTVTNERGRAASVTQFITVGSGIAPTVNFTVSPTAPAVNELVTLNASASQPASGRTITSYSWTFGDGSSGSGAITTHRYTSAGAYVITLTVTDDLGKTATASATLQVGAGQQPSAQFVVSPATPRVNDPTNFDASQSTAPPGRTITRYEWNFGDGTTDTGAQVTHVFRTTGDFNVVLTVTDSTGAKNAANRTVTVGAQSAPTAQFDFSPASPIVGQTVNFDGSGSTAPTGRNIVSYDWNFGDGGTATGSRVTRAFQTAGVFTVSLTVTDNNGGRSTATRQVTVGAGQPTAAFDFSPTTPTVGQTVTFDASASTASSGRTITSYSWNFGDGTTGTGVRPSKVYSTAGIYSVLLTVTDSAGQQATTTRTVTVAAGQPTAAFDFSPTSPVVGQTVTFDASASTASAGRTITSYAWNFGDGTTGTGVRPTKAYTTAGTYSVVLTVTDSAGLTSTTSRTVTVQPSSTQNPTSSFVVSPSPGRLNQTVVADASGSTALGGATIRTYQWNWGDATPNEVCTNPAAAGDSANCGGNNRQTISHVYTRTGSFTITLTVIDSNGRQAQSSRTLDVQP